MKYRVTNNRRGGYIVNYAGQSKHIPSGSFVDLELTEVEAKNAEYPDVTVEALGETEAPARSTEQTTESDDEEAEEEQKLRDEIYALTGKKPHHKCNLDTLRAQYAELTREAA